MCLSAACSAYLCEQPHTEIAVLPHAWLVQSHREGYSLNGLGELNKTNSKRIVYTPFYSWVSSQPGSTNGSAGTSRRGTGVSPDGVSAAAKHNML